MNEKLNSALGRIEETMSYTANRDLFSADYLQDLLLDIRRDLLAAGEQLELTLTPEPPTDLTIDRHKAIEVPDDTPGPPPVAVSGPTKEAS